ncbi:hypothetical protein [Marinobacter sp. ELB17]|uniref:hypothetical protein n=1 Tax=Marinobacter sp. ELB17 TaxID=270374 RepID=UPI0000F380B1|nr:hypothetical protein [Marinobacter sp. ELB17]EBA00426.1 hypothetical protein MELB17_04882 [Marinobacter sp. ELB17]
MISSVLTLFFLGFRNPVVPASLAADLYFVIRGEFAWNLARMGRVLEVRRAEHSSLLQ